MITSWLFWIGVVCLVLTPFTPTLVRIRISTLRFFGWQWAVELLENHFRGWVWFFRVLLLAIGAVLIGIAWQDLN